jgi:hypothetical protein
LIFHLHDHPARASHDATNASNEAINDAIKDAADEADEALVAGLWLVFDVDGGSVGRAVPGAKRVAAG